MNLALALIVVGIVVAALVSWPLGVLLAVIGCVLLLVGAVPRGS